MDHLNILNERRRGLTCTTSSTVFGKLDQEDVVRVPAGVIQFEFHFLIVRFSSALFIFGLQILLDHL